MAIINRRDATDRSRYVVQELLSDVNWSANFCMNGCESAPEIVQSEGINIFEPGVNLGLSVGFKT